MGASQGKDFPYEPKEVVQSYQGRSFWKLQKGMKKVDGKVVSIFSFDSKSYPGKISLASNHLKRAKTLRHPNIVPFLDGIEIEENVSIVTEELFPLEDVLSQARNYPGFVLFGIFQIAKALSFLNNDCKLIHGNVTMDSIFVNKAGDWKLGGFDLLSPFNDSSSILQAHSDFVKKEYKSPEYQKKSWNIVSEAPPYAVDSWMLGCLIYELFNGRLNKTEDLKKGIKNIPKELLPFYQKMLSSSPNSRLNPQTFLESECFDDEYVETCSFLENITLKEAYEKEKFFKKLTSKLDHFPDFVCKYKVLPHLVTALDFGSANSSVLGPLLKIGKELTPEEYQEQVAPSVVKWFGSNDRTLRMNLLQNLDSFVDYLKPTMINDQIFPNITNGFLDTSPALREATVKSMILLVPKMNDNTINQMLKYFAKLQTDPEPGIRTNTTICIAKIAQHLNQATREKVLAPAFSRATKDTFPKARIAALMSLSATQGYFSKQLCAMKIIPSISPLTIDPELEVRKQAFQTLKSFIQKLEQISETGEEIVEEPKNAGVISWTLGSFTKKVSSKIYGEKSTTEPVGAMEKKGSSSSIIEKPVEDSFQSSLPQEQLDGWDDDDFEEPEEKQPPQKSPITTNKPTRPNKLSPRKVSSPQNKGGALKLTATKLNKEDWEEAEGWDVEDDDWLEFGK